MLRLFSSLLVLLLGATASPARGARPRKAVRLRGRVPPDDERAADRVLEAAERPRARSRQLRWSWPGRVELLHDAHTVRIPGTWALESVPEFVQGTARGALDAASLPSLESDPAQWAERMRTVLSLQEPGTRLRIGTLNGHGWQTLEVAVPTRPPTIVQVDRDALGRLMGGAVAVRFRVEG